MLVEQAAATWLLVRHRPRLVYLNTVKSACYIRPALRLGRPVVLHVHELEPLASSTLARYRLGARLHRVRLVACSGAVRENLARITGVPAAAITVIPSTVDADLVVRRAGQATAAAGPFLVGACGTADQRKGVDLWLEMAREVGRQEAGRHVRFVWVGHPGLPDLDRRIVELGLVDTVTITGDLDNPYPQIAAMDVFTHAARQDPFPLAVLEAMALGRPVVAFATEGVSEQVGDAGVLVPAGDAVAMSKAVLALLEDGARRSELGNRARARATETYGIATFRSAVGEVVAAELR